MTLHRFFLLRECFHAGRVVFPGDTSRQIEQVLRLRVGDRVIALDGTGQEYIVRLDRIRGAAAGGIEECRPNDAEPSVRLVLYVGLLKSAKLETVLQKCTEIGVTQFVPVRTERSVATEPGIARQQRFETIVREAAEQSRRGRVPGISDVLPLADALSKAAGAGGVIFLWEDEQTTRLAHIPRAIAGQTVSLFVGPEGGFSPNEANLARHSGSLTVTLGRRILRAETAAIVGSALILDRAEDMSLLLTD